jgi:hypothetical protein
MYLVIDQEEDGLKGGVTDSLKFYSITSDQKRPVKETSHWQSLQRLTAKWTKERKKVKKTFRGS